MVLENFADILAPIVTVFGIIATAGYFTQIWKMVKRKSSADISLTTYILFCTAGALWLLYGLTINNFPLIMVNVILLIGAVGVIVTYFKYKK